MKKYLVIAISCILYINGNTQITPNQCTNNYTPVCGTCYNGQLCLVSYDTQIDRFLLEGITTDGIPVEARRRDVVITNMTEEISFNPILSLTNQNSWNNLPDTERPAIDALRIAELGTEHFNNLGLNGFLPFHTEIITNAEQIASFGNGPYAVSGTNNEPDQVHLTTDNLAENIQPDVLAHEFGHLYLNEHTGQLQNVVSLESDGIYEFLADMIGLSVESHSQGAPIDWVTPHRDLNTPWVMYNNPAFFTQAGGAHRMCLNGWHWAEEFLDSGCMSENDFISFLLTCAEEQNSPEVVNYPSLRQATLRHFYELDKDQACTIGCYKDMANAWHNVGVGPMFAPQTPIPIPGSFQTSQCAVTISWEDQGVPAFLCQPLN